ncbi:hypothetical protein DEJ50_12285 [Streptomyces venezuelae]|uniref:2Fe-2S ferredoxin-type domain-containing protein n=2 Tax=Streptomyces venezuelae TaxID=54571 RepID=A0A5P2DB48_STRVZ|nr:hypothetical protein DEJ50_12285 [Streptomyces venezuelae]
MGNTGGGWGWEPVPHGGEYDSDATAFVKLPEDMLNATGTGEPLAAPGHGYVPPVIVPPVIAVPPVPAEPVEPAASTDPAATTGTWAMPVHWPDAGAAVAPAPGPAGAEPDSGATAEWHFAEAMEQPAEAVAAPGSGDTGQWAAPVADWSQAPATLPGGAAAPWASAPQEFDGVRAYAPMPAPAPAAGGRVLGGPGVGTLAEDEPVHPAPDIEAAHGAAPAPVTSERQHPGPHDSIPAPRTEAAYAAPDHTLATGLNLFGAMPPAAGDTPETGAERTAVPGVSNASAFAPAGHTPAEGVAAPGVAGAGAGLFGAAGHTPAEGTAVPGVAGAGAFAAVGVPYADDVQARPAEAAGTGAFAPAEHTPAGAAPYAEAEPAGHTPPEGTALPGGAGASAFVPAGHTPAEGTALPGGPAAAGAPYTEAAQASADGAGEGPAEGVAPYAEAGQAPPVGGADEAERAEAGGTGGAPDGHATATAPYAEAEQPAAEQPAADGAGEAPAGQSTPDGVAPSGKDTAVPGEPYAGAAHEAPAVVHSAEHPLASYVLRVNGADRPVTGAWIGESLLYVLRERLGLAGAKDGCSQGECGACAVQVDGRLVNSCLVPAATAAGSEVRTVEGLATDGELSDVQQALCRSGAVQCGFCVPGMAMTIHDLLEGNHAPSELETRQALCGNLCRCSGYHGVLDAVREVVSEREAATEAATAAATAGAAEAASEAAASAEPRIPHQAPPGEGGIHPDHHGGMA